MLTLLYREVECPVPICHAEMDAEEIHKMRSSAVNSALFKAKSICRDIKHAMMDRSGCLFTVVLFLSLLNVSLAGTTQEPYHNTLGRSPSSPSSSTLDADIRKFVQLLQRDPDKALASFIDRAIPPSFLFWTALLIGTCLITTTLCVLLSVSIISIVRYLNDGNVSSFGSTRLKSRLLSPVDRHYM